MGSNASQGPAGGSGGAYVGQLAEHARKLQGEAREAIARGDYSRAAALIGDAELLAEDVHGLVDDIEHRAADRMMTAAAREAAGRAQGSGTRSGSRRGLRVAIGASLAMSLALVEC
jgi:hypothetical protein